MITKVISGGQTGADQGGLLGAKVAKVETGGTAPFGFITENGPMRRFLEKLGLKEGPFKANYGDRYRVRTEMNVMDADGTLLIGDMNSPGSRLTKRHCIEKGKPWCSIDVGEDAVKSVAEWIKEEDIKVLNVAGNREKTWPGIEEFTVRFIKNLINRLTELALKGETTSQRS